jgi:tetratricopeptide (TPR) repeat protein
MEQLEKIIKYLDGEVIGEEKKSFEQELASNNTLREKLELVKDVSSTLADEDLSNFISKIRDITATVNKENTYKQKDTTDDRKTSAFKIKLRYLSAASVFLVLAISSIFYSSLTGPKNEKIFNQFYQKYESSIITRSNTHETNDLIIAIQLYDRGNYTEAISRFTALLKKDNTNTTAHFFIGMSYMETKAYDKAITNFNAIIAQKDTAFVEHAEWYMALCYVRINRMKQASELLNQIATSSSFYKIKAVDLMKKL